MHTLAIVTSLFACFGLARACDIADCVVNIGSSAEDCALAVLVDGIDLSQDATCASDILQALTATPPACVGCFNMTALMCDVYSNCTVTAPSNSASATFVLPSSAPIPAIAANTTASTSLLPTTATTSASAASTGMSSSYTAAGPLSTASANSGGRSLGKAYGASVGFGGACSLAVVLQMI